MDDGYAASYGPEVYGPRGDEPFDEWNPTEDSVRQVRGKHRVGKQRSGGMARSGAVLGVGMIAAVGAGGMATAQDKGPASISMPDLASASDHVKNISDHLPDAGQLPGVGDLVSDSDDAEGAAQAAPLTQASLTGGSTASEGEDEDAGEALRARILAQAEQQQTEADATAREQAVEKAARKAAAEAEKKATAERKAEAEKKRKIAEEKRKKAEAERLAKLRASYTLPLTSYQLSAGYGQAGGMWQSDHTGQDFAAPNGTPVKAVHTGTVKEAGWAGSYGYRIVLELDDGTELWFCHLSSMTKSAGEKVSTGDVIGRVGSTGNSSGPHLHVEVRPGGGDAVDPLPWLRGKGLNV
nr:M23 family metallopeptidase [Streptomyces sulphureus]